MIKKKQDSDKKRRRFLEIKIIYEVKRFIKKRTNSKYSTNEISALGSAIADVSTEKPKQSSGLICAHENKIRNTLSVLGSVKFNQAE